MGSIIKGWIDVTQPSAEMLTVLNEEEDFTSEILRIHSLIEKSAWEWFDCLWRGKRYSYGRLNKNPFADEEKNERRELEDE